MSRQTPMGTVDAVATVTLRDASVESVSTATMALIRMEVESTMAL